MIAGVNPHNIDQAVKSDDKKKPQGFCFSQLVSGTRAYLTANPIFWAVCLCCWNPIVALPISLLNMEHFNLGLGLFPANILTSNPDLSQLNKSWRASRKYLDPDAIGQSPLRDHKDEPMILRSGIDTIEISRLDEDPPGSIRARFIQPRVHNRKKSPRRVTATNLLAAVYSPTKEAVSKALGTGIGRRGTGRI